jgi:cell division protein FtsN
VLVFSERTEEEARRSAGALQQQGFAVRVERAEIPLKGVWYRVLSGEFASKAEAQGLVDRLRRAGFKPTAMPIRSGR